MKRLGFRTCDTAASVNIEAIRSAFYDAGVDFLKHGDRVGITIVMPGRTGKAEMPPEQSKQLKVGTRVYFNAE